jgi:hypothetical protein
VSTLNLSVSSESLEVPEACPWIVLEVGIKAAAGTGIGSEDAPTTISLPRGRRPPNTAPMALEAVTVARITWAPPSCDNACAGSTAVESM